MMQTRLMSLVCIMKKRHIPEIRSLKKPLDAW